MKKTNNFEKIIFLNKILKDFFQLQYRIQKMFNQILT